jgi:DNA-binding transcriptional MerR regulator
MQAIPIVLPDEVLDFEGTAAELAERCKLALRANGLSDDMDQANERLVRHYVQLGVLTPPVRRGREAIFGTRQLAEFVIARILLRDGWPLAKIAELVQTYDLPLPLGGGEPAGPTVAERAIARIRAVQPPLARARELSMRRLELSDTLRSLGNPAGQVTREEVLKIRLTPWASVDVDVNELRRAGPDAADALGKALAEALRQEQLSVSGGDKR